MNTILKTALLQLISKQEALVINNSAIPNNYTSVIKCIIQIELKQEIEALQNMLATPESFAQHFKERCAFRETDSEQTISFHDMPQSPTNLLYWQIATLIFEPKSMEDMINIILPGIKNHLKTDVGYIPTKLNQFSITRMTACATLELLNNLDQLKLHEPAIERLLHYVFLDDILIDTKEIAMFPLKIHASLQDILSNSYPPIAKCLYEHNSSLHALCEDILILNNKARTPKEAIELLIKGLLLGGEKITGLLYAGQYASVALGQFFSYFNTLPNETKEQLRALRADDTTFATIIDKDIKKEECAETIASRLNKILKRNDHCPALTSPPQIDNHALKELINKYGPGHTLDTKKNDLLMPVLPVQLATEIIGRINVETAEDLIHLMIGFPPASYDVLWKNITINKPSKAFGGLAHFIRERGFNLEQKQVLAKVIPKYHQRFNLKEKFLSWLIKTDDYLFVRDALEFFPKHQRLELYKAEGGLFGDSIIHQSAKFPHALKALMESLPENQRLIAIQLIDRFNNTPLYLAATNYESLKIMLDIYPEEQKQGALKETGFHGNTILHESVSNFQCLRMLLNIYSQDQRLQATEQVNKYKSSVLYEGATNPESLKMMLELHQPEQRISLLMLPGYNGKILLEKAANNPESLKIILELVPENQRLALLRTTINYKSKKLSLLFILVEAKIEFSSTIPAFKDSFLLEFIAIFKFLKEKTQEKIFGPFFNRCEESAQLAIAIERCISFDEIKGYLIDYIREKSESALSTGISEILQSKDKIAITLELC